MLRRSFRQSNDKPTERSSSLPPDESRGLDRSTRGRSANPIGLSRQSSSFYDKKPDHQGSSRATQPRSQSLTRTGSFSDVRSSTSAGLKRQNSLQSVTSATSQGSDIVEPGWFSHAFHSSPAVPPCDVCGKVHDPGECEYDGNKNDIDDMIEDYGGSSVTGGDSEDDSDGDSDSSGGSDVVGEDYENGTYNSSDPQTDYGDGYKSSGDGYYNNNKRLDENNGEATCDVTVGESSEGGTTGGSSKSSGSKSFNTGGGTTQHHHGASSTSSSSTRLPLATTSVGTAASSSRTSTRDSSARDNGRGGNSSTVTSSFTAQNKSIQSELLGPESVGYNPKPKQQRNNTRNNSNIQKHQQHHDSDISSLTMDNAISNNKKAPGKKSKSFVGNMKAKLGGKKKKSGSSGNNDFNASFNASDASMNSAGTASTSGTNNSSRRRGRSLGLKMRSGSSNNMTRPNNPSSANPHPYVKRRSRSQADASRDKAEQQQLTGRRGSSTRRGRGRGADQEDDEVDRRVRERSRSIVRDAMSFMEDIDNAAGGNAIEKRGSEIGRSNNGRQWERNGSIGMESVQTEESCESNTPTIASSNTTPRRSKSMVTPSPASATRGSSGGVFLRNKFKDEQTLRELQDMHNQRRTSTDSSSVQSEKTMGLLSSLQETNRQNESTIQNLQEQLTDLTNERNAFRNNSERMMEVMTKQKAELEKELRNERKSFAGVTHTHKKEADEWRTKNKRMERRVKKLEGDLKEKTEQIQSREAQSKSPSQLPDTSEAVERQLQAALAKIAEMEASHATHLQELQAENEGMKEKADEWKGKHDLVQKQHQDLLDERDDESAVVNALENKLEGCRVVIESMKATDEASVNSLNDELVEKIGDLADENGVLSVRIQKLERELSSHESVVQKLTGELDVSRRKVNEASATIETLQVENRNLRVSFANQGKQSKEMKDMVRTLRSSLTSEDSSFAAEAERGVKKTSNKSITEMEHAEALETIEEMQAENDALHKSMEEAIAMASGMNEKMAAFVKSHDEDVAGYEARVASLKDELNEAVSSGHELSSRIESLKKDNKKLSIELEEANSRLVVSSVRDEIKLEHLWNKEKRELSATMDNLKEENKKLHESLKEMNSLVTTAEEFVSKLNEENKSLKEAQQYYHQQLEELNTEKEANSYLRDEIKTVSTEREEAYGACKVLQQEINVLRLSVKESEGRVEQLHSDTSTTSEDNQEKLAQLTKANKSLTKELEQKNEALQAVKSALESLKDEQATIKETINDLREENAKLRDTAPLPLPPPPAPKSILKSKVSFDGSQDSQQITKLESKIKKIDKENKGLREANTTLSTKLFDEMEKTDALRVANEGLAARICKLVAFIQKIPSDNNSTGGASEGKTPSGASSSAKKRSKSTDRPKKKKK